ncbi:MAG: hypothetical protein NUV80_07580 [Candidatus Berkelbacteria bacterium]|nr:hypothetical protein [Candidatus Berkelbacteria bacterium]
MLLPDKIISETEMTRTMWIAYKWQDVRTICDNEAKYLFCGLREISEAGEAAKNYDVWHKSASYEIGLDKKEDNVAGN